MHSIREARLRPEYAGLYPGLEAGVWYAAATIVEYLVGQAAMLHAPDEPPRRVLTAEHFEFRGGSPAGDARHGGERGRAGD